MMVAPFGRVIAAGYRAEIQNKVPQLLRRLDAVADGRVAPAVDDIVIGSGRKVTACVIFFDIRNFTQLTSSDDANTLKRTLFLLNCVIPAMMRVLYRYGAYVEKNTGDGLMAVLGVDTNAQVTAKNALDAAAEMFYVLHYLVNPILAAQGIQPVDARIGMDMGPLLLARIGLPTGSSAHERSSLTAVGPAANRACKLQGFAGTNEIWCGDSIRNAAPPDRLYLFADVTPPNWNWHYGGNANAPYRCWRYDGVAEDPFATILGGNPLRNR
ncbi:adenylate/guanylate cyclase domain-containing protein [[Pseudomonas] boreopolis]|uniref:adenylate/guanylate cyclase domain-containing protein n=1 Tax=Xanthomonas boreopolis TaxID=86183 RepID=UPI003D9FCF87